MSLFKVVPLPPSRFPLAVSRQSLAAEMGKALLEIKAHSRFNDEGDDSLKLPRKYWEPIPCYHYEDGRPRKYTDGAFRVIGEKSPSKALASLVSSKANNRLECGSTVLASIYLGLVRLLGPEGFDHIFSRRLVAIAPLNVSLTRVGCKEFTCDHPFFRLLTQSTGETKVERIQAGDIVYFRNYDRYEELCPDGAFAGEWTICVRHQPIPVFNCFGIEGDLDANSVKDVLREKYKHDTGQRKTPGGRPTIDEVFRPDLSKLGIELT